MGSIELPAMRNNPKIIFFSDFDGTITLKDSNDYMTDNLGFGPEKRRAGHVGVLEGRLSFRDAFQEMVDSIKTPLNECIDIVLDNMELDPNFIEFYHWSVEHNVPIVVLSSGMVPIILALITKQLGQEPENIQIVANDIVPRNGKGVNSVGGWNIKYRDDSHFGHDKSLEIRQYADLADGERPTLLYAGDGVSDLSAARQTDLLFAKEGRDLVTYCHRENIPFTEFNDWSTILSVTKDLWEGNTTVQHVVAAQKAPK